MFLYISVSLLTLFPPPEMPFLSTLPSKFLLILKSQHKVHLFYEAFLMQLLVPPKCPNSSWCILYMYDLHVNVLFTISLSVSPY